MLPRSIDFRGIFSTDKKFLNQLDRYIKGRADQLSNRIVQVFSSSLKDGKILLDNDIRIESVKTLEDAIIEVRKRIEKIRSGEIKPIPSNQLHVISAHLNQICWDYIEILESCVIDFFQEFDHMRIDTVTAETITAVQEIEQMIENKIVESITVIKKLKIELSICHSLSVSNVSAFGFIKKWFSWGRSLIDPTLISNLNQTSSFLHTGSKEFKDRYESFQKLNNQISPTFKKFDNYQIFLSFEQKDQEIFLKVYRALKLWSKNLKKNIVREQDLIRIFKSETNVDYALGLFKVYFEKQREALFSFSKELKEDKIEEQEEQEEGDHKGQESRTFKERLQSCICEVYTLGSSVNRCREFLLRTDPNPYVRSRWGFSESIVGPEPTMAKSLHRLSYEIERLNVLFSHLSVATAKQESQDVDFLSSSLKRDIQNILHEIGQPLASRSSMKKYAESLVECLEECNELASKDSNSVDYVGEVLSRALKADWRYHVFHEVPHFHQVFNIHMGIVGTMENKEHSKRIQKFGELFQELQEWIREGGVVAHSQELKDHLSDLRSHLHDFLVLLQGYLKDEPSSKDEWLKFVDKKRSQLLDYRYLFGSLCYHLGQSIQGSSQLRKQYLLMDQQFESIEKTLKDLELKVDLD